MAISPDDIRELLGYKPGCNPGFFGITFTKRTNGETRRMGAMMGVKKHLTGGGSKYDFNAKGLLPVWDGHAARTKPHGPKDTGYRSVPADAITQIRAGGQVWNIIDGVIVEQITEA